MICTKMSSSTFFPSKESEKNWVNSIIVVCQTDSEIKTKPCIFRLSKELKDSKAEEVYYAPQKIGLGPFHHCHQKWNTNSHKIPAIKKYLKINKLQQIVDFFKNHSKSFEPIIRLCYGADLDLDIETLLLILIIDTIYLLHLINTYVGLEEGTHELRDHEWVRDIMMLENQIPLVLIQEVLRNLKRLYPELDIITEDDLFDKYYRFCGKLYPVRLADVKESMRNEFSKTHHLLHFMHQLVVGTTLLDVSPCEFSRPRQQTDESVRCALRESKKLAKKTMEQIIELLETAKTAGVRVPPWSDKIENPIKAFNFNKKEPEAVDKILSVSELQRRANIKFGTLDVGQGFGSFKLDREKKIIYLPIMRIDENTEVILRNLLAYEAEVKEAETHEMEDDVGVSEVKDHMGLMCAITKTEEDVRLLKECQIIETEMNYKDVVEIFKGLKRCMEKQHLKSKFLDVYKRHVKKFSENDPLLKAFRKLNKWIEAFFKFLKTIFPILVVLLLFFQSFCEIHNCRRQPLFGNPSFLSLDSQAEIMPPRKVLSYST